MRVIVRADGPHLSAQLRLAHVDARRSTALATNVSRGQRVDLELQNRCRADAENRIRPANMARRPNSRLCRVDYVTGQRSERRTTRSGERNMIDDKPSGM